jgi:hypothetical protein
MKNSLIGIANFLARPGAVHAALLALTVGCLFNPQESKAGTIGVNRYKGESDSAKRT